LGRATTSSRYDNGSTTTPTPTPTPTPSVSTIHYSGTPQTATTTGSNTGGVNITGQSEGATFKFLTPKVTIPFSPAVRELGEELADKLASATYITTEELGRRFPNTQADIQAEINQLDRIASAQRLEKVRALSPAETTYTQNGISWNCVGTKCEVISQPTPATPSSVISILPFVIVGILALVFILIWRAR